MSGGYFGYGSGYGANFEDGSGYAGSIPGNWSGDGYGYGSSDVAFCEQARYGYGDLDGSGHGFGYGDDVEDDYLDEDDVASAGDGGPLLLW